MDLCFPAFCLCCEESIEKEGLCTACSEHLQLIDIQTRCPFCFEEKIEEGCLQPHTFFTAFCCEDLGPAGPLIRSLTSSDQSRQKNIGSLMVVQLCLLGWPMPDFLLPFPPNDPVIRGVAQQMRSFVQAELKTLGKKENLSDKNCLILSLRSLKKEEKESLYKRLGEADPKAVFFLSFS
jgi:hypothetical protein